MNATATIDRRHVDAPHASERRHEPRSSLLECVAAWDASARKPSASTPEGRALLDELVVEYESSGRAR